MENTNLTGNPMTTIMHRQILKSPGIHKQAHLTYLILSHLPKTLRQSNFNHKLGYMKETPEQPRRNRQRSIIWFNPPFSKSVKTYMERNFLSLIDKNSPPHHKLHKLFNRNTVKVIYSCMAM
jgi:hypothetical protein